MGLMQRKGGEPDPNRARQWGACTAKEVARHEMPHTIMKPSPAIDGSEMSKSATAERTNDPLAREVICAREAGQ